MKQSEIGHIRVDLEMLEHLDISIWAKTLYAYLKYRAYGNGHCWPSEEDQARTLRSSKRTMIRARAELEKEGLIQVKKNSRNGHGNTYELLPWNGALPSAKLASGNTKPSAKLASAKCQVGISEGAKLALGSGFILTETELVETEQRNNTACHHADDVLTLTPSAEKTKRPTMAKRGPIGTSEMDRWFDEEFWPLAWRIQDKGDARRAFFKHVAGSEGKKNQIIAALKRHWPSMKARDDQFQPHMATWLNKRRYEEEPEDVPANGLRSKKPDPFAEALKRAQESDAKCRN